MPTAGSTFFESAAQFRTWLAEHGSARVELIVGFWKVGTGRASMTWPESVDEALCFGWIDGVRKRIDDAAYQIRFTPRKKSSIWSAINIAKVQALTEAGRMAPAGLAAYAARTAAKSLVYSYEQRAHPELLEPEVKRFQRHPLAWSFFEACPPSYRKPILHWIVSAKKPQTRDRRLAQLIEACGRQERLLK